MAKIDVDDYMFECAVCIEQINDTWRMLPCQHTFCLPCLEKLFTIHEQPLCPTCRKMVTIPIGDLERPRLLLTLFEKLKLEATRESETKNLSVAIEQSMDDYRAKQEIDHDRQHLEIALRTSADQAVLEAEKELLTDDNLTAVIQLSIHEHNERELKFSRLEKLELDKTLLTSERDALLASERYSLLTKKEQLQTEIAMMLSSSSSQSDQADACVANLTAMMESFCITSDDPPKLIGIPNDTESNDLVLAEACFSSNNLVMENDLGTQDDVCSSAGVSATPEISGNNPGITSQPPESIIENSEPGCAYVPCIFDSFNLGQYLKKRCERTVLNTILTVNVNQEKIDSLKKRELKEFLEIIDDYLIALECYRRDQMDKILEDSAGNHDNVERILIMEDWDNGDDDLRGTGNGEEDGDLNSAIELSRQTYLQRDEAALLGITLKKSEILDPILSARHQLLDARDKLEFRLVIIESEEYY